MHRAPPPPDFRYVGLSPGPAPSNLAFGAAGASTAVAALLLVTSGTSTGAILSTVVAGCVTAMAVSRYGGLRALRRLGAVPTAMGIVPWGVLIRPEAEVRVVRWSGVKSVAIDHVHTRDANGNASTTWSFVVVETLRERLVGRAAGSVPLERLVAHVGAWAEESSRPIAFDLEGEDAAPFPYDHVARELVDRAAAFARSGEGAGRLSLEPGSYRDVAEPVASGETAERLRAVLRAAPEKADPRAFAAILAGDLGATALVPELLRLVTSPHPMIAACAKAAALKLGAAPTKTGALREVAPFVLEEDVAVLEEWAKTEPE